MRGWRGCFRCYCCRSMVVDMVGRAADRAADKVGRVVDRADRVAGGSCCSCCFRRAGKGMEEVVEIHSHIPHL